MNVFSEKEEALSYVRKQMKRAGTELDGAFYADPSTSFAYSSVSIIQNLGFSGVIVHNDPFRSANLVYGPPDWICNSQNLSKEVVAFTMHETTQMKSEWIVRLNKCRAVVFPSFWGASCANAQGLTVPVYVCPLGHDCEVDRRELPDLRKSLVFATVASEWGRKGTWDLISAFVRLSEDVELWIRSPFKHSVNDPRIKFFNEKVSRYEYWNWLQKVHFGVFPSKGEGFGLPQLEFAAFGIPVVAPRFGSVSEFLSSNSDLTIEGSLTIPSDRFMNLGRWFQSDGDSILACMKNAISLTRDGNYLVVGTQFQSLAKRLTWVRTATQLKKILSAEGIYQ